MGEPREFHAVVLAALLHDIGKFLQRGRSLAFDIDGPHPEVSARFVTAFAETFDRVADANLLNVLVRRHHRGRQFTGLSADEISDPRMRLLAIMISTADGLSASERGQHAGQWQDFKTAPLASVFSRVFAGTDEIRPLRYHPVPLAAPHKLERSSLFPDDFAQFSPGELEACLKEFGARAAPLVRDAGHSFDVLLAHLLRLLQAFTWAVPSDTQELVPDVSLFDHLRTTAAIAACLYHVIEDTGLWEEAVVADREAERFILAVGDVSGIQEYIFGVSTAEDAGKGIARRLRARSLFVQLLSETVPLQILRALNLPVTNTVMASGGKFYLLLPRTATVESALTEAQRRLDGWFHHEMNGLLALNLAWAPFSGAELAGGQEHGFGGVVKRAMDRLAIGKDQRFREALQLGGRWEEESFVFPPFSVDQQACVSCHKFPAADGALCLQCSQDLQWGSFLRKARYAVLGSGPVGDARNLAGTEVALVENLARMQIEPDLVLSINDPDAADASKYPAMFRYMVTHGPADESGQLLTFKDIAEKSAGRSYLGFMKADVDRLGEVFAFGVKPFDSISRLATLSRQMDLFFTGWVEHLLEVDFSDCYPVFSGGDDVLVVGPWDRVLDLAGRIRDDFTDFAGHNIRMTLSAGMAVGHASLPMDQAVHQADACLEWSKAGGRDRLTILDHTLQWADWQSIRDEWHRLRAELETVTSSFLYGLLEYAGMWRKYRAGDVMSLRFQPLLACNVARNLDPRRSALIYAWARSLVEFRPGDREKELVLDNLGLLAQLLILGKKGGEG